MKRLILTPEQVLATNDTVPEENQSLKLYYRIFAKGGGESLPPIVVGTIKSPAEWISRLESGYSRWERSHSSIVQFRRREYKILFARLGKIPYFILDGNHRALAAALNRCKFNALLIDSDRDLVEIERLISIGELISFPHSGQTVESLEGLFIRYFLNLNYAPPDHSLVATASLDVARLVPVATRAYDLCTSNKVPRYMIRNYSARKTSRSRPREVV